MACLILCAVVCFIAAIVAFSFALIESDEDRCIHLLGGVFVLILFGCGCVYCVRYLSYHS